MQSTVFKLIVIIMLIFPLKSYAYEIPKIQGETLFNETAEKINSGKFSVNPVEILNSILQALTKEIKESSGYIVSILFIAALSALVRVLTDSLGDEASVTAAFACFVLMSTAALKCFFLALDYGNNVISMICDFITKLTPTLIMTLFTCGDVVTAGAFEPIMSAAVYVIAVVIEKCLIPLICFSAILSVAGNINEKVQISNFCRVLKSVSKWVMVAIITVFTSISALYGFSAPSLDALSGKAVKFAVGSLVPVVGGFLSDTLDTVLSGTRLMKNAVGVSGMVSLCVMSLIPVLKIFIIQLLLKVGAALCEPIADKRISNMMWEMSDSIMMIFAVVVMITVLFLINISIILLVTGF